MDSMRLSEGTSSLSSSHIARLINNWDIKFDGTPKLSVESFIYRIESQVVDSLNGNFPVICEHIQSLLNGKAKDWYWSYRRSVSRVNWSSFCDALRLNFEEHTSDAEIKETMRNRKQGLDESFDDYRHAMARLAEKLSISIPEAEMLEILLRGLRPRIRQQLLYIPIYSITELRRLCLKGEHLLKEISKVQSDSVPKNKASRRAINELDINTEITEEIPEDVEEIDEISRNVSLCCWNCRQKGHRYHDCVQERTVFCYGCGAQNTYKPNCENCNSGNWRKSEVPKKPRYDNNK